MEKSSKFIVFHRAGAVSAAILCLVTLVVTAWGLACLPSRADEVNTSDTFYTSDLDFTYLCFTADGHSYVLPTSTFASASRRIVDSSSSYTITCRYDQNMGSLVYEVELQSSGLSDPQFDVKGSFYWNGTKSTDTLLLVSRGTSLAGGDRVGAGLSGYSALGVAYSQSVKAGASSSGNSYAVLTMQSRFDRIPTEGFALSTAYLNPVVPSSTVSVDDSTTHHATCSLSGTFLCMGSLTPSYRVVRIYIKASAGYGGLSRRWDNPDGMAKAIPSTFPHVVMVTDIGTVSSLGGFFDDVLGGLLDFHLVPFITIGGIVGLVVTVGVVILFIKLFAGG